MRLDDLSTGRRETLDTRGELIEGDIDDEAVVREAVRGAELVFHQAAAGSVALSCRPTACNRQSQHPRHAHSAQGISGRRRTTGCLCLVEQRLRGGGNPTERRDGYAVAALALRRVQTCRRALLPGVRQVYGLATVALRYFNVYGPPAAP